MINIIILFIFVIIFKLIILGGFGYYTLRHVDRPDCYASEGSSAPISFPKNDDYENVTAQYMTIIQIGFWLAVIELILFVPSIRKT